jgi:hypothetical protein
MLTTAYESLTPMKPNLPSPDSPLPSLLALRLTHKTLQATKYSLAQTHIDLRNVEQRLEKENADLEDATSIGKSLEKRIDILLGEIQERSQKSPSQVARETIKDLKKKKATYESETGQMVRSFNRFVDDYLAVMLAAEELGGPVVGEIVDPEELDLESGLDSQGQPKKLQGGSVAGDKRQRRIDEIWGEKVVEKGRSEEPREVKRAAASEMRELTEQLLNNLVEADGGGGDTYVELSRESAAARFLVRAKVGQFHPKDARRLRLIDFGRDLDE